MNNNLKYHNLNGISLIIFFVLSIMVVPINIGFAVDREHNNNNAGWDASSDSFQSTILPTAKTIEDVTNTCGTPVNVKDSLIMSVVTICIPGILEKVKEWKEISCEASVCKYNAIKGGVDPSFCEKQKEYKFCKFVWGEIFSVPPLAIIEVYKDMIKNLIANPIGILYGVGTTVARSYLTTCGTACPSYVTVPTAGFLFVVDVTGVIQTFKDMAENSFNGGKIDQNYCEQARDIRDELEEVIETYKTLQDLGGEE